MKYTSISSAIPNVSLSRSESSSPSLKMDSRGFPCISWLSSGNNINNVNYSFWDGLKWAFYDVPKVYISDESIVFSPNALVLDPNDSPVIAFARKINHGFRLSLATYNDGWNFNNQDVNYDVSWIGVIRYDGGIDTNFSSSSSKSWSTSSSSSSSGGSFSSFSSLSSSESSSSSSGISDSDSSISTLSSSSSSSGHVLYYVCAYDSTNAMFKVYLIDNGVWSLFTSQSSTLSSSLESLKITVCGRRIGIAFVYGQSVIKYNFLNMDNATWSFNPFSNLISSVLTGDIVDMSIIGDYKEDDSILFFGWLSYTSDTFYVNSVYAYNSGTEIPSDRVSKMVESQAIYVTAPSDYVVNGYRKIGICLNDSNQPVIITMGSTSKIFTLIDTGTIGIWNKEWIGVEGISDGIVPNYLNIAFSSDTKISIAADSGDIYYFEPTFASTFPASDPDVILLNSLWAYRANYASGALNGLDISGTYDNIAGSTLIDTQRPLLILSNRSTPVTTTTTTLP